MEAVLDRPVVSAPVSITEAALSQFQIIRQQENIPDDYMLRVGVKGGGCSGYTYVLGFDSAQDNDEVYEVNGLKVIMNRAHSIYVLGMQIDFLNGLDNRGFTFDNPNATSTCGCGTSFSA
jgi:iron-sulfur cluster assembly protein